MEAVKAFHEEEEANGFPMMKKAQALIRAHYEVLEGQTSHPLVNRLTWRMKGRRQRLKRFLLWAPSW